MSQAKVLTDRDIKIVLATIKESGKHAARNRAAFMLSYLGGMRVGEIAALKVSHILNADQTIRDRIHLLPDETKGKSHRTVILSDKLQKELSNYIATLKHVKFDRALIASQKANKPFSSTTLTMLFKRIYMQAGIADARSHSGRRTYITKMSEKAVSVFVLKELAGHKSIATTQLYVSVSEDQMIKAANLL